MVFSMAVEETPIQEMSKQPYQIVFAVANTPKMGRKSGSKSRSGCLTCKARHIKCTEEKPECKRCTMSGKKCSGYAPRDVVHSARREGTPSIRPARPKSPRNDLSLTVDSAMGLPCKHLDRRYLDHFRTRSVEALSRLGDQEFWNDLVLRLSASRPTIQNAVLALSAQHEACLNDGVVACAASTYALRRYSKGIKGLNQMLANTTSELDLLEVVVACSLFASFEIMQGNGNAAMRHGRGCLQILSEQIKQRGDSADLEAVLDSKPAKFLIRLDVDTAMYGGLGNVHELTIRTSCPSSAMHNHGISKLLSNAAGHECASFFGHSTWQTAAPQVESVVKARDELYSHLARNYYFERNIADPFRFSNRQDHLESVLHDGPKIALAPDEIYQWQNMLLANMFDWNECLRASIEPYLSASWTDKTKSKAALVREYASITVACMSSYMSVYTCLVDEEEAQGLYDNLLPQFQCLVRHAEMIILPESSLYTELEDWGGSILEMGGIIQPLTFTALKCRDRNLRSHAIFLLSQSGRHGGWDGQNMARLVQFVVDYEERQALEERKMNSLIYFEDVEEDSDYLSIPLCARVSHAELELDQTKKRVKVWMRCGRESKDECVLIENW